MTLRLDDEGDMFLDGERLSNGDLLEVRIYEQLPWVQVMVVQPEGSHAYLSIRLQPAPGLHQACEPVHAFLMLRPEQLSLLHVRNPVLWGRT